ncbi:IclR family transcriptional regulator [Pyruvatibacter mobilis]|uniref:IclR family transcriptional regulator n=1 Tax=Pyruvatibacter mobilis TaxID=1712261 RepID=UPI003D0B6D3B
MDRSSVKSAERTLALFEFFAAQQRALTIGDIASGMGMPQSSTSALVRSLVTMGYLEHNKADRTYFPTMRITLLGAWMQRRSAQTGLIPSLLTLLADKTGETAVLAIRNGIYAQYVFVQQGADPLRLHVESGMLRPLTCCAAGWVLMAHESREEIGRIIRRTQAEAPREHWRSTASCAVEEVQNYRKRGYAESHGQTTPGAGSIAIAIPSKLGSQHVSVSVGGPLERVERNHAQLLDALRAFANDVNAEMLEQLQQLPRIPDSESYEPVITGRPFSPGDDQR